MKLSAEVPQTQWPLGNNRSRTSANMHSYFVCTDKIKMQDFWKTSLKIFKERLKCLKSESSFPKYHLLFFLFFLNMTQSTKGEKWWKPSFPLVLDMFIFVKTLHLSTKWNESVWIISREDRQENVKPNLTMVCLCCMSEKKQSLTTVLLVIKWKAVNLVGGSIRGTSLLQHYNVGQVAHTFYTRAQDINIQTLSSTGQKQLTRTELQNRFTFTNTI